MGLKNLRTLDEVLLQESVDHWDDTYLWGLVETARLGNLADIQRVEEIRERMDAKLVEFFSQTRPEFSKKDIEALEPLSFAGRPVEIAAFYKGRCLLDSWLERKENKPFLGQPKKIEKPSSWKRIFRL